MGLRALRAELQRRCSNRAAVDKNPYKLASQITPEDVRAAVIAGYEICVQRGFFENADRFARSLVVERDAGNPARFNIGMKEIDLVNPADIFAGQAIIWAQTRA
jgi:phage tail sheath gpL-like